MEGGTEGGIEVRKERRKEENKFYLPSQKENGK